MMEKDWETDDKIKQQEMWKDVGLVRFMVRFSLWSATGSAITQAACVLVVINFYQNETLNTSKLLMVSSEFFYDTESSPAYELTWIFQLIASCLGAFAFANLDGFFIFAIFHLCAQLRILQMDIQNMIVRSKKQTFMTLLRQVVKRHLYLIRYKFYKS